MLRPARPRQLPTNAWPIGGMVVVDVRQLVYQKWPEALAIADTPSVCYPMPAWRAMVCPVGSILSA